MLDENTRKAISTVLELAKGRIMVQKYEYHKTFPDKPTLGEGAPHHIPPLDVIEAAGGYDQLIEQWDEAVASTETYLAKN
jgi:hypothetical protein